MSELRAEILPQQCPWPSLKRDLFLLFFSSLLLKLWITKKHNKISKFKTLNTFCHSISDHIHIYMYMCIYICISVYIHIHWPGISAWFFAGSPFVWDKLLVSFSLRFWGSLYFCFSIIFLLIIGWNIFGWLSFLRYKAEYNP